MAFKHYKHLNVPDSWERYFTKYPQGMSILEALFEWVSQVDSMVDNQNNLNTTVETYGFRLDDFLDLFDTNLRNTAEETLKDWQKSGFLDVVINEALQWQLDDYITTTDQNFLSVNQQLTNTTTEAFRKKDLEDLTSRVLLAIEGGEGTSFNLLSIPQDKSVTPEKTTFIKSSTNKFDVSSVYNSSMNTSGVETESVDYRTSQFIKTTASTSNFFYGFNWVAYYDVDKTFIKRSDIDYAGSTLVSPSNAYFMKVIYNDSADYPTRRVNEGTVLLPYEYYYNELDKVIVDGKELINETVTTSKVAAKAITSEKTDFIVRSTNLFDVSSVYNSSMNSSGVETESVDYRTSQFIENLASTSNFFYGFNWVAYYDEDKNFIKRSDIDYAGSTLVSPSNAYFMKVIYNSNSDYPTRRVNKGTVLLPYEDYYMQLDDIMLSKKATDKVAKDIGFSQLTNPTDRFMFDVPIDGVFDTDEIYADYTDFKDTTASEVYAMFDNLMSQYPDFVKLEHSTTDALGNRISTYSTMPNQPMASETTKIPVAFFTLGVHGYEHQSTLAFYLMLKQMCEKWQENPLLEALLYNVKFIFIPVANPSGWDVFTRVNHNGVDINRNFPSHWSLGTVGSQTYGGSEPLSELESQYIKRVFDENPDINIMYDFHNFFDGSNGDYFIWLSINTGLYQQHMAQNLISRLTRKWKQEFPFIPDNQFVGYTNGLGSASGTIATYARSLGINFSGTLEVCNVWVLDENGTQYDENVNVAAVEVLVNWLLINLRELNRLI